MSGDHSIDSKIDEVIASLNDYYSKSFQEGASLKNKIDVMEKKMTNGVKNEEMEKQMTLASEQLDTLVDSLMLTSGKLSDLKDSCKKIEDLMTSLLCYSLSRFRKVRS